MPNRLIDETSPYLLQHAHNPVDWYPWGEAALDKAKAEDKPVFLSIGYAACHWCHVMERESFENEAIARLMNDGFISIKVDREERPDLDMLYMQAVIGLTGSGGWPMSVFLTPEGKPFYGGTYFPPERRHGMPGFGEVLSTIHKLWVEDRTRLLEISVKVSESIAAELDWGIPNAEDCDKTFLDNSVAALVGSYDWQYGGWGQAPRFPAPMAINFLLSQVSRGSQEALKPALHALRSMARGGMYDLVGGGFHRYSTDDLWLVPHFEKMLYDNAQLSQAYLNAYLVSGDLFFKQIAEQTLEFVLRELADPAGGFYSSLDADSGGQEGAFYLWNLPELQHNLSPDEFKTLERLCEIKILPELGDRIILRFAPGTPDDPAFSTEFDASLRPILQSLLAIRSGRVRPATDDKVLVAWNGLTLLALAEAGRHLNRPDFITAAQRNARFLLTNRLPDGRLQRSWRQGKSGTDAFLEDYASLILALLALYQADFDGHWLSAAFNLAQILVAEFNDPPGSGFYVTRQQKSQGSIRPKDLQDNATPSGNALAAAALLSLCSFSENPAWRSLAEGVTGGLQATMARYPTAFGYWLKALDLAVGPIDQVAVTYPSGQALPPAILAELNRPFRPRTIQACASYPLQASVPEILQDRPPLDGKPTVFICRRNVCQLPRTDLPSILAELKRLL